MAFGEFGIAPMSYVDLICQLPYCMLLYVQYVRFLSESLKR